MPLPLASTPITVPGENRSGQRPDPKSHQVAKIRTPSTREAR
jgi:hypothetical protein